MTGIELKAWCKKMKLNTTALAKELDLDRTSLHRYYKAETVPSKIELALETIERKLLQPEDSMPFKKISVQLNPNRLINDFFKEFGSELKIIRESKSFSQELVATIAGLNKDSISDLENGKNTGITLSTILKLAKALEIKIEITVDYKG